MPRANPGRWLFSEEALAKRVAAEREQRGWSYEGLAQRMTEAGCSINQSALYKIERGTRRKDGAEGPARRITVDELVALSRVFGVPVEGLLLPPEAVQSEALARLVQEWHRAVEAESTAAAHAEVAWEALREYVRSHPELRGDLEDELKAWASHTYGPGREDDAVRYHLQRMTGEPAERLTWARGEGFAEWLSEGKPEDGSGG